ITPFGRPEVPLEYGSTARSFVASMLTAGGSPSLSRSAAKGVAPAFSGGGSPNTKISRTDVPRAASRALSRNSGIVIRYFAARSRSCRRMKLEYGTSGMGTSGCGLRKITVALILSDMTLVRAAVLVKPKTLEAREFARPTIGPDDGLLRIEACGICGSDYEQYEGAQPPHEDYTPFPVIPGHEPLGVIEEIGANARQRWGVREGDRVAVRSGYGCGRCEACSRWEPRLCRKRGVTYGYTDVNKPPQLWGGYAELMYLSPYTVLKKMDPKIPAGVAVMFNPLAAGLSWAASVPGTGPGDRVVVLGVGQRGLCSVIAARAAGAKQVVITGLSRDAQKLALARELGADATVNAETDDVVARVRE